MNEIRVVFESSIERTSSICSFRFKAKGQLVFTAGQYLQFIFDEEDRRNRDLNKFLSFSCAPDKEYFEVTKRLSSSKFSEKLKNLKAGDEVLIKAPMGKCILHEDHKKVLFLVGGIGITPVISMLEDVVMNKKELDACLIYANRHYDDVAFADLLEEWRNEREDIRVVHAFSDCEPVDVKCEIGNISHEMLERRVFDYKERMIYVFGPPAMVNAVKGICRELGCDDKCLLSETFVGY